MDIRSRPATRDASLTLQYDARAPLESVWLPISRYARQAGVEAVLAGALGAAGAELAAAAEGDLWLECRLAEAGLHLSAHGNIPAAAILDLESLVTPLGCRVRPIDGGWCIEAPIVREHGPERRPDSERSSHAYLRVAAEMACQREDLAQLGRELEETNRGVVALHMELDQIAEQERTAVRVRDELLAIASHDLRSPLTALQMRLEILKRAVDRGQSDPAATLERVRQQAVQADAQAVRFAHMLEVLLDVSRISAGQLELKPEPLELGQLLQRVVEETRIGYGMEPGLLELRVDQPIRGHWDALRLEQVVTNLLTNAFKYGQGAPVLVAASAQDRRAHIQVRDQGPGIPRELQKRIFQSFTRGEKTARQGSVGLGLWIVRRVVAAMGGSVTLDSKPGLGTTFTIELPLRQAV